MCRDVGTGESVPTFLRRRVSMIDGDFCCPCAAGMKSPGTVSRMPYNSSSEEVASSFFGALRIPNKIHGNSSI